MNLIKKYGIVIFWAILLLDCALSVFDNQDVLSYTIFTKPLLMITIGLYFYTQTARSKHYNSKRIVYLGLFMSFLGDILTLINDFMIVPSGDNFLFLGLVCYALSFLLYTRIFIKMNALNIKDCQEAFISTLAMGIGAAFFYKFIKSVPLANFKYLIIIQVLVLTVFVAFAANVARNKTRKNISNKYLLPGAITITLAMTIIVSHRFLLTTGTFLPGVVILTYGFGQMLIFQGFTKYLKA